MDDVVKFCVLCSCLLQFVPGQATRTINTPDTNTLQKKKVSGRNTSENSRCV
jgi:hypothetical protein